MAIADAVSIKVFFFFKSKFFKPFLNSKYEDVDGWMDGFTFFFCIYSLKKRESLALLSSLYQPTYNIQCSKLASYFSN